LELTARQCSCAYFALAPACVAVGAGLRHSIIGQNHPALPGMALLGASAAFYAAAQIWARIVPASASIAVGILGWTLELWLACNGRI